MDEPTTSSTSSLTTKEGSDTFSTPGSTTVRKKRGLLERQLLRLKYMVTCSEIYIYLEVEYEFRVLTKVSVSIKNTSEPKPVSLIRTQSWIMTGVDFRPL